MDSFYSIDELQSIGFKSVGKNVFISKKASIYGATEMILGNCVRIDDFCILSGHIEIGNYIHIAAYTALYGGTDGIFIDDFANLSSRVCVYSISDDYSGESMTNPMVPEEYKMVQSAPVRIKRHVIIGSTSVVMPGTVLEEGSSFGAFSFINKNSEPWSRNIGVPCKKVGERSKNLLVFEEKLDIFKDIDLL